MAFLGDFGSAVKELDPDAEKDTFSFFGEKFEVVEALPPFLLIEIGAFMDGKIEESAAAGAMWTAWKVSLGEEEFARFQKIAIDKRADVQSLMELVMNIFQATGGERPTVQVPDSPAGVTPTSPSSSTSVSTLPVSGEVVSIQDERDPSVPHLVPVSRVLAG